MDAIISGIHFLCINPLSCGYGALMTAYSPVSAYCLFGDDQAIQLIWQSFGTRFYSHNGVFE